MPRLAESRRLAVALEALHQDLDVVDRVATDPVQFPRRYGDAGDMEVAAVFAASLAYGRVSLFRPVVSAILKLADAKGGPRRWIETFGPADAAMLAPLQYRWTRGPDLALLARVLHVVLEEHGGLEPLFRPREGEADIGGALDRGITALRRVAVSVGEVDTYRQLSHGFRHFLPVPGSGSACKRWCMLLRWMVRPAGTVDLGLWSSIGTHQLVIPLDTHVARIARFLGLTERRGNGWRTAREITRALAVIDPADPVRFDFAVAHLGISGRCKGVRDRDICPTCPLDALCVAPEAGASPR